MTSTYGGVESSDARPLRQNFAVVNGFNNGNDIRDIAVRMVVPNHPMWHFVDEGEEIELYVTFPNGVVGIPYTSFGDHGESSNRDELVYEVDLAGEKVPLTPLICFKTRHRTMFKATKVVRSTSDYLLEPGRPVPFNLQYKIGERVHPITEVTEPNMPVYYQPVWKTLRDRDYSLMERIDELEGYDGVNPSAEEDESQPGPSGSNESEPLLERSLTLSERGYSRSETPIQVAGDDFFLYYARRACKPFFEAQNPFLKVMRELMVSPLTNFTGLSLYFQLYLVEIFHVKFFTKLCHYMCMPMIVLLMATWFAQFRFIGHYKIQDVSIFIVNGTLVFLCVLQAWYLLWGFLYRMCLFGIFMLWPLFFMYMLANMLFQIIVIKSIRIRDPNLTASDVRMIWCNKSHHWYDFITLSNCRVFWYLNPLLWALVFSLGQALSHAFEDKLPPRVSHTAHWLDITTILKEEGYAATSLIVLSQLIFGTLNEFVASPRLLPLLLLRLCYNLGYDEAQWVKFRLLVDECLKFGDPAIDYIGRGGARWPKSFNGRSPDALRSQIRTIELGLSKEQKQKLKDPEFLQDERKFTQELKYYVLLRHRLTKYMIQANAYGPFTPRECDERTQQANDDLMEKDFPDNPAFRMFLEEARAHFAEMEYRFVQDCQLNRVF